MKKRSSKVSTLQILKDLAAIFFIMAERDKKIEIRKQVLADMHEFNPWLFFKMFSLNDPLGYLSSSTLYAYLKSHDIETTIDEVQLFVKALQTKY